MPKTKPKKFRPYNPAKSPLRMANFVIGFAVVGLLFVIFAGASPLNGMYGSVEKDQADRINAARPSTIPNLQHIECLNAIAEGWTKKMAAAGVISHNPNLAAEASYACGNQWRILGENVGITGTTDNLPGDSLRLFNAFMKSPPHQANIVRSSFTEIGVGAYVSGGRLFVTHVFAGCSGCGGAWNTAASLPADPKPVTPPSTWHSWASQGGTMQAGSAPAAASWGSGRLDIFTRSNTNTLQHKYFSGGWSGWSDLGGNIASSPAAVSWGANRIDIFAKSPTNTLIHKAWNGSSWTGWSDLGGTLTSAPSVSSWGSGRLDVFARGSNGQLMHKWYSGGWSGWEDLGGALIDAPSAVSWGSGRIDIFAKGTDNAMHHKWFEGGWGGWENLGGVLTSAPAATSMKSGRLDIYVRGGDNAIWGKAWVGGWSKWVLMDSKAVTSGPGAVSWADRRVDLFARGGSGELLHKWYGP